MSHFTLRPWSLISSTNQSSTIRERFSFCCYTSPGQIPPHCRRPNTTWQTLLKVQGPCIQRKLQTKLKPKQSSSNRRQEKLKERTRIVLVGFSSTKSLLSHLMKKGPEGQLSVLRFPSVYFSCIQSKSNAHYVLCNNIFLAEFLDTFLLLYFSLCVTVVRTGRRKDKRDSHLYSKCCC